MNRTLILAALLTLGAATVHAQSYSQTNRAFVQSPMALGMGDAGVAFPSASTAFFYNPAHLAHVAPIRPHVNIIGLRGSLSSNLSDQLGFFNDTLEPAIDEGFDNIENDRLREIYDETLALGQERTFLGADLLLPSVMLQVGGVGIGAGVFGHSLVRYRFPDGGAGIPMVDLNAVADLIGVGSAGVDFGRYGIAGLSLGATVKFTRRAMSLKLKPLDAVSPDEDVYLYSASALGFDVGLLYDLDFLPLPGKLRLGVAAFDVAGSDFEYQFDRNVTENSSDNAALITEEEAIANELYGLDPSYRVGLAYTVPSLLGFLNETGIAVDYLGYTDPTVEQAFLAGIHVGVQANLKILALRAGLNSGYTTVGAGLNFGFLQLDYAYYAQEEGRIPGQLPSWNHSAQMTLGF
ncbi:MAG: conjugal transfer protein TraF [Rhodothermales bacterium]|nr:conjugal transfer protein TraF [Rhodothermales bacterium]